MREDNSFDETEDVMSMTECTGLIPALPQSEAQDANLAALYAIHKAAKPRRRQLARAKR